MRGRGSSIAIFTHVPDAAATEIVPGDSAEAALAFLTEMSPDLRGAAILGADGAVLAATGESPKRWAEDAAALLAVADAAEGTPVEQVHVATEQGEVFAIRDEGLGRGRRHRALRPRLAALLRHARGPARPGPRAGEGS